MTDKFKSGPALPNASEEMARMVEAWAAIAGCASDIAHSKRTIYLAYVAEGFTEAQALELCKMV